MGFEGWGSRFWVWVWDVGCGVWGVGCEVWGVGFGVWGLGFFFFGGVSGVGV